MRQRNDSKGTNSAGLREQARALLSLYPDVDRAYLERRVREETLDEYGVEDISG